MLTGTATAAVLTGAVELNAYWYSRYTRGRSNRTKKKKKATPEPKNDKRSKKKQTHRDSPTVRRLDDSAQQQERESLATKLGTTTEGSYGANL